MEWPRFDYDFIITSHLHNIKGVLKAVHNNTRSPKCSPAIWLQVSHFDSRIFCAFFLFIRAEAYKLFLWLQGIYRPCSETLSERLSDATKPVWGFPVIHCHIIMQSPSQRMSVLNPVPVNVDLQGYGNAVNFRQCRRVPFTMHFSTPGLHAPVNIQPWLPPLHWLSLSGDALILSRQGRDKSHIPVLFWK